MSKPGDDFTTTLIDVEADFKCELETESSEKSSSKGGNVKRISADDSNGSEISSREAGTPNKVAAPKNDHRNERKPSLPVKDGEFEGSEDAYWLYDRWRRFELLAEGGLELLTRCAELGIGLVWKVALLVLVSDWLEVDQVLEKLLAELLKKI